MRRELSPPYSTVVLSHPSCGAEPIWEQRALPPMPCIWSLASSSRRLHPPQKTGDSSALTRVFPQHKHESDFHTFPGTHTPLYPRFYAPLTQPGTCPQH